MSQKANVVRSMVLAHLTNAGSPQQLSEVANAIGSSPSTARRHLQALMEEGEVECKVGPTRAVEYSLKEGAKVIELRPERAAESDQEPADKIVDAILTDPAQEPKGKKRTRKSKAKDPDELVVEQLGARPDSEHGEKAHRCTPFCESYSSEEASNARIEAAVKANLDKLIGDGSDLVPAPERPESPELVKDFMLFIGGTYYTPENFAEEAARLGISRRMPTHRLPAGLVCGKSRIFVAAGGKRATNGEMPESMVFGYFIPTAVEFIKGNQPYTDIIAQLQLRPDSRIVGSVKGEAARGCGTRKEGGTYLVVDKADSPLVILAKAAKFVGNHFRGLMALNEADAIGLMAGEEMHRMIQESCMCCGASMFCAPDGHMRAERERKRIDRGELPKWRLKCQDCAKRARAELAASNLAADMEEEAEIEEALAAVETEEHTASAVN